MADRILDRDKHPQWQGERTKMVYSFPKNEKLWDTYAEILADSLRSGLGITKATAFYREHRNAMDDGAHAAWCPWARTISLCSLTYSNDCSFTW